MEVMSFVGFLLSVCRVAGVCQAVEGIVIVEGRPIGTKDPLVNTVNPYFCLSAVVRAYA